MSVRTGEPWKEPYDLPELEVLRTPVNVFVVFDVQVLFDAQMVGLDQHEPILCTLTGGDPLQVTSVQYSEANLGHDPSVALIRLNVETNEHNVLVKVVWGRSVDIKARLRGRLLLAGELGVANHERGLVSQTQPTLDTFGCMSPSLAVGITVDGLLPRFGPLTFAMGAIPTVFVSLDDFDEFFAVGLSGLAQIILRVRQWNRAK